mgnify:CR=1 FL=1
MPRTTTATRPADTLPESAGHPGEPMTLDQLTHRVGMSVRNVRFYTTKGLVPPPIRHGRSGYYSAEHLDETREGFVALITREEGLGLTVD